MFLLDVKTGNPQFAERNYVPIACFGNADGLCGGGWTRWALRCRSLRSAAIRASRVTRCSLLKLVPSASR